MIGIAVEYYQAGNAVGAVVSVGAHISIVECLPVCYFRQVAFPVVLKTVLGNMLAFDANGCKTGNARFVFIGAAGGYRNNNE